MSSTCGVLTSETLPADFSARLTVYVLQACNFDRQLREIARLLSSDGRLHYMVRSSRVLKKGLLASQAVASLGTPSASSSVETCLPELLAGC